LTFSELFEADQGLAHVRISKLEHDIYERDTWSILVNSVYCYFRDKLND